MDIQERLNNCKTQPSGFHVSCDVDAIHRRDGKVLSEQKLHNIVVDYGLNFVRELVASSASTDHAAFIGLGLSATAPVQAATDLTGPYTGSSGLERSAGAVTVGVGSVGMYAVTKTFTCATANASVGCAGLYTQVSGSNLFAGVSLSSPPVLQAADTLQIIWTVQFS